MVVEGLATALELLKSSSEIAYQNFINVLRAEQTNIKYSYALDKYIKFLKLKEERNDLQSC